jgi:hypothetical protein
MRWRKLLPHEKVQKDDQFFRYDDHMFCRPDAVVNWAVGSLASSWNGESWWPYRKIEHTGPRRIVSKTETKPLPLP